MMMMMYTTKFIVTSSRPVLKIKNYLKHLFAAVLGVEEERAGDKNMAIYWDSPFRIPFTSQCSKLFGFCQHKANAKLIETSPLLLRLST